MSKEQIVERICGNCEIKDCVGKKQSVEVRLAGCRYLLDRVGCVETRERAETKEMIESKEMVNHPSHYNQYPIETIDMMVSIFGKEAARQWCVMTAFKYRMRLGHKDDINQDLAKEQWYLNKAKELE